MTSLKGDINFVAQAFGAHAPRIKTSNVFLGGSRVAWNGEFALKNSDYDLLMLVPEIERPVSLTIVSRTNSRNEERRFDAILRDRATLAYDFEEARNAGRGTLVHMCAHSEIVRNDDGLADEIQQKARLIHRTGPRAITQTCFANRADEIQQDAEEVAALSSGARMAGAMILGEKAGVLALRGNRQWWAKGKVLARFLEAQLPSLKSPLEAARSSLVLGKPEPLQRLLEKEIPPLYRPAAPNEKAVVWHKGVEFPAEPKDESEVFHYARQSGRALREYRRHKSTRVRDAANHWLAYKHNLARHAVDPDRFGRPNGEYDYAVARYVGQMADLNLLRQDRCPETTTLPQAVAELDRHVPDLGQRLTQAMNGQPNELLRAGDILFAASLNGRPQPIMKARVSPAFCRADAAVFS